MADLKKRDAFWRWIFLSPNHKYRVASQAFTFFKVILFLNKCQLTTFYVLLSVWFWGKDGRKRKGHNPYFQRAQAWYLWPNTQCCDFFWSQQVMFSIMKIPNVKFLSSPSNNEKWANSSESDFFLMKIMTVEAFLLNANIIRTQRKTQGQFIMLYILPRC